MIYALCQGVFLGSVSRVYELFYNGIVQQAIVATVAAFFGILFLYRSGRLRATPKFTRTLMGAAIGYLILALGSFVGSFFGLGGGMGGAGAGGLGAMGMGGNGMGALGQNQGGGFIGGNNNQGLIGRNNQNQNGMGGMNGMMNQFGGGNMNRGQRGNLNMNSINSMFGNNNNSNANTAPPIRPRQKVAFDYPVPKGDALQTNLQVQLTAVAKRNPKLSNVLVSTGDAGEVILRGAVKTEADAKLAEHLVRFEPGVRSVRNELTFTATPEAP